MSKETKNRFAPLVALLLFAGAPLAGCDTAGPAEKAGAKIDEGAQKVKDTVDPPGPGQKAGRAIDDAAKP